MLTGKMLSTPTELKVSGKSQPRMSQQIEVKLMGISSFPQKSGKMVSSQWASIVSPIGWRLTVSTVLRVNLAITKSSLPDHTIILPRRHCGQSGGAGAANSGLTIIFSIQHQIRSFQPHTACLNIYQPHSQMHQTVKRCEPRSIHPIFPGNVSWLWRQEPHCIFNVRIWQWWQAFVWNLYRQYLAATDGQ